jgi:chromosomal replication initiation ATPase DnaA
LKTVLKSSAESSLRLEEVFPPQLFANNPDLQSVYDRYLTFASPQVESDGILLTVPTLFHKQALLRWKEQLEKISGVVIKNVDVNQNRPKRENNSALLAQQYQQVSLPLAPQNPVREVEQREKERRFPAPKFVTSPSFELCYELAKRWAQNLFQSVVSPHSILWVFGSAGSGKTHLVRQFNSWIPEHKRLHFVDVMAFFHEWRHALENNGTFQFIKKYRKDIDVLVLENFDDIIGKRGTQQELLFTISALIEKGAYVVVSSTHNPSELKQHLEPQLHSRLLSGVTIEMPSPDKSFKESLLRKLLHENGLKDYSLDLVVDKKS